MSEVWKNIQGYKDLYLISNHGRVMSSPKSWITGGGARHSHNGKILKAWSDTGGYQTVELKDKAHLVHRLVGIAFIPNPENKPDINHKDGIKSHNHSYNLEWCTESENLSHAYQVLGRPTLQGVKNHFSKLAEFDVKVIRILDIYGMSSKTIAEIYHVDYSTIRLIIKRKTWKHI